MNLRQTLLLMQFCVATFCLAQYPYTIKISCPDPLSTPVIYDMMNDSKGYIWLATDKGLIKFNSRSFQVLPFTSTQLKSVAYINEDKQGKIWCANFYKQIFYVEHDSVKLFEVKYDDYYKETSILNFLVGDESIFVTTLTTCLVIDKKTHTLTNKIALGNKLNAGFQHSILYNNQLFFLDRKNKLHCHTKTQAIDSSNQKFFEIRLAVNSSKIIAVERGKRKRLAMYFDGKEIMSLPNYNVPENAYVYHLSVTGENEIWICTQNGAYLWDYETGNTKPFFINERVSDVVKDFQGNYWFSTLDNGLFKCPNLNCIKIASPFSNNNDNATKIYKLPNNNFLIGNTKGEVAEIDRNNKQIKSFKSASNEEIEFLYYSKKNNNVYSDGGMFDYNTGKLITPYEFGKVVSEDDLGNLIISTFNRGMLAINSFGKIDTTTLPSSKPLFKKFEKCNISISGKPIRKALLLRIKRSTFCLADNNNNGFWVAYDDDLYYYNYNGTIKIIKAKNGASILATHLVQFKNQLYVSTTTNGLFVLEDNIEQSHFTTANGLQSNNTKKAIIDDNKIWLLTDKSLEMIDTKTGLVQDFFSSAGLEALTVYDFAIDDNRVLLATPGGVMEYTQTESSLGERIKITQLSVENNNKEINPNTVLNYNQNAVTIKLDAIHYKSPSKLLFHYRLIGSDNSWHTASASNNVINYNSLAAGNYTFEVYAADVNMIFRSTTSSFSFAVAKPLWQKWWFICLLTLGTLIVILLFIRWWMNRFKIQQTAKENLLQSKLTAIRSQMNPHFLYNVLNTVQGLVYANKKSEATEMLGNFSDLMRKTLQESDKTEIVLRDEIESLQLYLELEKKRFDKDFEFEINVDQNIDIDEVHIPSMFIQPFAENAIKHGLLHKEGEKKLIINILQQNNKLFVTIDDNGAGRKQSSIINQNNKIKSTGFAIKGIEERMTIYNAMSKEKVAMEIIDKEVGTIVKLTLPIK